MAVVMQEFEQKGASSDSGLNHLRVHILPLKQSDSEYLNNEEKLRNDLDTFMKK